MLSRLEAEALHYWIHVRHLRVASVLGTDTAEATDELDLALKYSSHDVIRRDIARALRGETVSAAK